MQHERVLFLPSEAATRPLTLSSLPPSILAQSRVHLSWLAGAAIVAVLAVVPLAAWLQPEAARAMGLPSFRAALALVLLSSAAMIGMVLAGRIARACGADGRTGL